LRQSGNFRESRSRGDFGIESLGSVEHFGLGLGAQDFGGKDPFGPGLGAQGLGSANHFGPNLGAEGFGSSNVSNVGTEPKCNVIPKPADQSLIQPGVSDPVKLEKVCEELKIASLDLSKEFKHKLVLAIWNHLNALQLLPPTLVVLRY